MKGRPVVAEVMAGAGAVSEVAAELTTLEEALADPARQSRIDEMDKLLARFGEVQARFDELGGYALEARAREILDGLGFSQEVMDGDVGQPLGRLEDARRPGAHPAHAAGRHAARRAFEPPRSRVADLAGGLSEGLRRRAADDLARSRVPQPHRRTDHRDRRRRADQLLGQPRFLREAAGAERGAGPGGLRSAAVDAGQGDALHRALQGPGRQGVAGAVAGEEARQDREGRAAQAAQDAGVRVPPLRALGRGRRQDRRHAQALRLARRLRGARPGHPPQGALGGHGRQRRRQVDAAQAGRRRDRARRRNRLRRAQRQARLLRAARDGHPRPRKDRLRLAGGGVPAGQRRRAEDAGRLLRVFGRRRRQDLPHPLGRREGAPGAGAHSLCAAELPGARRADQPPRHRHQGHDRPLAAATTTARCCSSRTIASSWRSSPTACWSWAPTGPTLYGGGYLEYVARSGHEAPGLH